jgi:hypothetical protein
VFRPNLRAALPAGLTAVALLVVVIGAAVLIRADRSRRGAADVQQIARAVELPLGSTSFSGVMDGCPTAQYLQCGQTDLAVDVVALRMQAALSAVAKEKASLSCTTLPSRQPGDLRSCLVRINRGGHTVMISIDPIPRVVAGRVALAGAQVRIQAD